MSRTQTSFRPTTKRALRFARLILALSAVVVGSFLSCHATRNSTTPPVDTSPTPVSPRFDHNPLHDWHDFFSPVARFVFVPRIGPDASVPAGEAIRLRPVLTPWGEPWQHEKLCRNMNDILLENGIELKSARVRMIAHAVVSSGWRQNVWHYNAWGVKRGSWKGPWYRMPTVEEDALGQEMYIGDEEWRAFSGWPEAVEDYRKRITIGSRRPSYRQAARYLHSNEPGADAEFWRVLGEGNYYTARKFPPGRFTALCFRVRRALQDFPASPEKTNI